MPGAVEARSKYFTLEEANRTLPLVRAIVSDIVEQFRVVAELQGRLSSFRPNRRPRVVREPDPYAQELAQTESDLETEEGRLRELIEELDQLGVGIKGAEGICDFRSRHEGRDVYLCWRLGESEIRFWHEIDGGYAGRKPITLLTGHHGPPRAKSPRC